VQPRRAAADSGDVTRIASLVAGTVPTSSTAEHVPERTGARHCSPETGPIDELAHTVVLRADSLHYGRHAAPMSELLGGLSLAALSQPVPGSYVRAAVEYLQDGQPQAAADGSRVSEPLATPPSTGGSHDSLVRVAGAPMALGLRARLCSWIVRGDKSAHGSRRGPVLSLPIA
jgi:hypothetical protein